MITVECYGHGPGKWLNENREDAQTHGISEDDAAGFISIVTQGGYGEESICVLDVLAAETAKKEHQ